jgi:tRNA pseudouridine55 synthase
MEGVLVIDKPSGFSSFGVVKEVQKILGVKKAGHTGTLDPSATGLLLVCLGRATKLSFFLSQKDKVYQAKIILGMETDTMDGEGKVIKRSDSKEVSLREVTEVIKRFKGEILQRPPVYSAIKIKGVPLYRLARKGIYIKPKIRKVKIYSISLDRFSWPELDLTVHCGKGTYMRSLASDIGRELNCGGFLKELKRIKIGSFDLSQALSLKEIKELARCGKIQSRLIPISFFGFLG